MTGISISRPMISSSLNPSMSASIVPITRLPPGVQGCSLEQFMAHQASSHLTELDRSGSSGLLARIAPLIPRYMFELQDTASVTG